MRIFYFYLVCFIFPSSYSVLPFYLVYILWFIHLFFFLMFFLKPSFCVCVCFKYINFLENLRIFA